MNLDLRIAACAALALAYLDARADVDTGPYVGVGLGAGGYHVDSIGLSETNGNDHNVAAGKLYFGYRLTPNWGVEAGYATLGNVEQSYASGTFKGHGRTAYFAGVGRLLATDRISLYAKLMITSSCMTASGSSASAPEFARLRGTERNLVLGGLGVEYAFSRQVSGSLDLDSFGKYADKVRGGMVSANLKYHF